MCAWLLYGCIYRWQRVKSARIQTPQTRTRKPKPVPVLATGRKQNSYLLSADTRIPADSPVYPQPVDWERRGWPSVERRPALEQRSAVERRPAALSGTEEDGRRRTEAWWAVGRKSELREALGGCLAVGRLRKGRDHASARWQGGGRRGGAMLGWALGLGRVAGRRLRLGVWGNQLNPKDLIFIYKDIGPTCQWFSGLRVRISNFQICYKISVGFRVVPAPTPAVIRGFAGILYPLPSLVVLSLLMHNIENHKHHKNHVFSVKFISKDVNIN